MSWDLLIATQDLPDAQAPLAEARATFTIDAPRAVELEDLPETLADALPEARFLVEISTPAAATAADRSAATRVALDLAGRFRGAVYDPQADEVVWPRAERRPTAFPPARIRAVELAWFVALGPQNADLPLRFLEGLRAECPEALPRRYDEREPFQRRFEPGGEEKLVAFWNELAGDELRRSLSWKSRPPCFSGAASFPDKRATYPSGAPIGIPGTRRCSEITLQFDGRILHADERWCASVVALFSSMARRLNAFYAAAHVQRNVIAKRALWYDGESEASPLPFSFFAGIPAVPTWLAWFGAPYAPHVEGTLRDRAARTPDGSWLFLGGPAPMDRDELARHFPALPPALLFRARPDAPPGEPRVVPAEIIPAV